MNQSSPDTSQPYRGLSADIHDIRDAILLVEADTRIVRYCNRPTERIFGYPAEELIGHTTKCLHVDEDHYRFFGGDSQPKLDELGYFKCRFNMRRRDGAPFPSTNMVMPTSGVDGTSMVISIIQDDSDCLEKIAEQDALVDEIARDVATARELGPALRRTLGSLCRYFQWDRGEAWMPENGELKLQASWRLADGGDPDSTGVSRSNGLIASMIVANRVGESGKPEWLSPDSDEHPAAAGDGQSAICGLPVCAHREIFAVAVFSTSDDRDWDPAARGLMEYIWALLAPTLRELAMMESAASPPGSSPGVGANGPRQRPRAARSRVELLELMTRRESEVAELMVDGLLTKEIAHRLDLSPRTVEGYRAALKHKLRARTLPELNATLRDLLPAAPL